MKLIGHRFYIRTSNKAALKTTHFCRILQVVIEASLALTIILDENIKSGNLTTDNRYRYGWLKTVSGMKFSRIAALVARVVNLGIRGQVNRLF